MRLGFGNFYGRHAITRRAGDFDCAVRDADPDAMVVRHTHEDAHFVLVLDGLYRSSARGAPAVAAEPVLVYNPPGTTHRDRFESRGGPVRGRFLTISVRVDAMPTMLGEGSTDADPVLVDNPRMLRQAMTLAAEVTSHTQGAALALESGAIELLGAVTPPTADDHGDPRWLRAARERMLDAPDQPVTVAELARDAGVHPVHFARVFRRAHGISPATFMRRRRVELAVALLRHTARPIGEIAASTGYVDQSHLHRAVRQRTGMTPGRLRASSATKGMA